MIKIMLGKVLLYKDFNSKLETFTRRLLGTYYVLNYEKNRTVESLFHNNALIVHLC